MARNLLSARAVQTAKDGDHSDGDGLSLQVKGNGASWVFRYTSPTVVDRDKDGNVKVLKSGKPKMARPEMGLGPVVRNNITEAGKSLTAARVLADAARALIRLGRDPIEERDRRKAEAKAKAEADKLAAKAKCLTLCRVARDYHERVIEPNRTRKHAAQWLKSLETHVPADLWHAPIDGIEPPALLDAVAELQAKIPETASRIRQRLEAVFDDAEFRKLCSGNPARAIRRKLREASRRRESKPRVALPYAEAAAFMVELRKREAIAARALEFAILTAARTCEVIAAKWAEFDLGAGLWVVPGDRMKGGETHTVYLSPRAVEIAKTMQELGSAYVFPSPDSIGSETPAPLSNMAMLTLLQRRMKVIGVNIKTGKREPATVHGFRSTFSTWANDCEIAQKDVIEACLAHREADRVRAAYNRADFGRQRRKLLQDWADYCDGKEPVSNVIPLKAA